MAAYADAFGERIRDELRRRDLSPYQVEDLSRGALSHMTVRRMAKGNAPSSDHIVQFAEALESDPEERRLLADDLLQLADRRVRYIASVTHPLLGRPGAGVLVG